MSGDGWQGQVVADPSTTQGKVFQRKIHTYGDGVQTVRINSYAWADIWNGEPMRFSSYA